MLQLLRRRLSKQKPKLLFPPQGNLRESKEAPQGVQGNDVHMKDSTHDVNDVGDDVAMCGTLSTLSEQSWWPQMGAATSDS
jgi:hypothetical protein